MHKQKLLIADDSEEFSLALGQLLADSYEVRCCQNGKEALALLHSFQPDIFVLELMLAELDGISLLQAAAAAGIRPKVLAITLFFNEYAIYSLGRLGIGYAIRKPCDLHATAERIRDLSQAPPYSPPPADPKGKVTAMLHALSVPSKLHGYTYLREAILEMARNPGQSITKELYPTVAAICGCSSNQVERSIRTAIASAWEKRDEQNWKNIFQRDSSTPLVRPTNSAFITQMAEELQML